MLLCIESLNPLNYIQTQKFAHLQTQKRAYFGKHTSTIRQAHFDRLSVPQGAKLSTGRYRNKKTESDAALRQAQEAVLGDYERETEKLINRL